jgi:two-component system OmpR family sensor kinase
LKLRTRLSVGLGAVAIAFAVTGWLVASTQRRYLTEQLDRRLENSLPLAMNLLDNRAVMLPPEENDDFTELFIGHLAPDGTLTVIVPSALTDAMPSVTAEQAIDHARGANKAEPFTVSAEEGGEQFRVIVLKRQPANGWDLVALSLDETDAASDRLLIATSVGGLVVFGVITLTWLWVVRLGVKPITEMTFAADAINRGEQERRMPMYPPRTEADRLSRTFNDLLDARHEADERLRQFVADASHELRTPLTSIRGYTDLYHQGAFQEQERLDDAMRRVSGEAERMTRIVNDLLLLSKLDQGVALDLATIDLAPTLADVVADARVVQPARPITLSVAAPLTCRADAHLIHQVVAGLVHNALVHTPADSPLEVRGSLSGGAVMLEVADHGLGMDPETATHAFERFYRGDPSRTRNSGGSGLGLAIARSIIEAHGGRVSLQTSPGQGCLFRLAFPVDGPPVNPSSG